MRLPKSLTPLRCIEWFAVANLAFLGADIFVAHSENAFREPTEWIPIVFSAIAPLLLLPGALRVGPPRAVRWLDLAVGAASLVVGVSGMVFHLTSAFFLDRTLASLVYSAPFIAPLSYVGVGLLVLLARLEPSTSRDFGAWVLFLALGGFVGNLGLSLLDHAQNDFFSRLEWVPVVAAAFGCSFYLVAVVGRDPRVVRWCYAVSAIEAAVGVLGFALHVIEDVRAPSRALMDRFVHGAPPFAPLLFANLALLAAIGLWAMSREPSESLAPDKA